MDLIQNVIEYYDELYPVTDSQKKFYADLMTKYTIPVKILRVDCGTGYFEHLLAREGHDVTGIETSKELLESANLKRRNQLMSIRFFLMSYLDMTRFLGKGFYNIISCLNDRILFIHDRTLMRKFFFDCKELLAPGGTLVLQLTNFLEYNKKEVEKLPTRESIRAKLYTEITTKEDGTKYYSQEVENGNGKFLPVIDKASIYPLTPDEIEDFAEEAGFSSAEFYTDFSKTEFTGKEPSMIVLLN